jgi:hypothetical protein
MKLPLSLSLLAVGKLLAFEEIPWIDFPYEFQFRTAFSESYYSEIAQASLKKSQYENSFNEKLSLNLGVATLSQFDFQVETEFFQSKATHFTLQSLGAFIRSQVLDDIQGDLVSLTLGTSIRYVPDHALKDPIVPYQNLINFEANLALGKEFDIAFDWTKRFAIFTAVGIANDSGSYLKVNFLFDWHRRHHLFGLFAKSYFGFGTHKTVNIPQFHGYGNIRHQSIDVGATYRYLFDIYGSLSIDLFYRVYAFCFPKNETAIELRYQFPFSIF